MSKKGTKALASATLMSLVLTTALSAGPVKAAAGQATRVGAADRYATAAQVATTNWKTSDNVVLVSGDGYADAVSASALAKKLDAPILLTTAKSLSTDTKDALAKLGAKNVYVVGGEASVASTITDELGKTYKVERLAGANRYETNVAVAQKLVDLGVKADDVIMVGGEGFSDALSVAPVAAAQGKILLLGMNNADYIKPVLDFVKKNNSKVTVVGTKNVISEDILKAVGGTRVDGGKDRWDTNQKVLANFKGTVKFDKLYVASAAYNAQDNGYADALVASALAGKYAAPLVLVDKDGNEGTTNALAYIKANANKSTDLQVVGGTGVVSDTLLGQITNAVNPTPGKGDATVQTVEAINLNQFKVTFNTNVDEDSAETISNYKVDGSTLAEGDGVAVLQDDARTVIVTLKDVQKQYDDVTITVKKGILDEDKTSTIPEFEKEITFADTTVPTLKSVSVKGNTKLTVEFSEAVNMKNLGALKDKIKINGQSIGNFGLNEDVAPQLQLSKIKDSVTDGSITWSNKVDLYFNSPLPTGTNTLKISDADNASGILKDAAGFAFKETTMDFTVDSVTTKPVVKEVTNSGDGKIYVKFDRPMDKKTAWVFANYQLNKEPLTKLVPAGAKVEDYFDFDDGDCTLKIKGLGSKIETGSNTLYIDDAVKDAYGNKVADDTRVPFTRVKDETKPVVSSVTVIDSETIRVKFSEDVKGTYARNISNYKLKDSKATDITTNIDKIVNSNTGATSGDTDTYDIKMKSTNKLSGSKYTLTIKNIADTSTDANVMEEYTTTIEGSDDVAPKAEYAVKKIEDGDTSKVSHKAVVYFSEEMDSATLENKDNFKFVNGKGDTKNLPSNASLSVGGDNKSVIVEFPDTYKVAYSTVDGQKDGTENDVYAIVVGSVKDLAGNTIDGFAQTKYMKGASAAANIKAESFRVYSDGNDVKVDLQFDKAIDKLNKDNFKLVSGAGLEIAPNSGTVSGDKITLTFRDEDSSVDATTIYTKASADDKLSNVEILKRAGSAVKLQLVDKTTNNTVDESGASIKIADVSAITPYNYEVAPKTTADYWHVTLPTAGTTAATITLTFDSELDSNSGVKLDDFIFTGADGTDLKAADVKVTGNTIVYTFDTTAKDKYDSTKVYSNYFGASKKISVRAKSTASVRTIKDKDDGYASYTPTSDDTADRVLTGETWGAE